ncbi:MAG: DUF1566 domain-containing protein [Campylobacterota bacterium]|nr:DUF1566 domain-containing protein [Campylobacterota bacterium]
MKNKIFGILILSLNLFAVSNSNTKIDNLMWYEEPSQKVYNWNEAGLHCENLSLDGEDQWRLPTIEELSNKGFMFKRGIGEFYSYYWSSTIYSKNNAYVWAMTNSNYKDYLAKDLNNFVSCVADIKVEEVPIEQKIVFTPTIKETKQIEQKTPSSPIIKETKQISVIPAEVVASNEIEVQKSKVIPDIVKVDSSEEKDIVTKKSDDKSEDSTLAGTIFFILLVVLLI